MGAADATTKIAVATSLARLKATFALPQLKRALLKERRSKDPSSEQVAVYLRQAIDELSALHKKQPR